MAIDIAASLKLSKSLVETARILNTDPRPKSSARNKFLEWHRKRVTEVARTSSRSSAFIMGGGNCTDFDLDFATDYFGQVVIADLDSQSVYDSVSKLGSSSRAKVRIVQCDLNGSVEKIVSDAEKALSSARSAAEAVAIVSNMLNFGEISLGQKKEPFGFVYSANLASSFAFVALTHLYAKMKDRFPDVSALPFLYDASNGFVSAMPFLHLTMVGNHFDAQTVGFVSSTALRTSFVCPSSNLNLAQPSFLATDSQTQRRIKSALYSLGFLLQNPNFPNSLLNLWQFSAGRSGLSLFEFGVQFILDSEDVSSSTDRFFDGSINETLLLRKSDRPSFHITDSKPIVFLP